MEETTGGLAKCILKSYGNTMISFFFFCIFLLNIGTWLQDFLCPENCPWTSLREVVRKQGLHLIYSKYNL